MENSEKASIDVNIPRYPGHPPKSKHRKRKVTFFHAIVVLGSRKRMG